MNSKDALHFVEKGIAAGIYERVSPATRNTKAIIFRTRSGRYFAVEINDNQARNFAKQSKIVLEARPGSKAIDWDDAKGIPGIKIFDRQWASHAYRTAAANSLAEGKQMTAVVQDEHALRALLDWYDDAAGDDIDRAALRKLRDRFIASFPDFEEGGGFAGHSRFLEQEDVYKRELVTAMAATLTEHSGDDEKLGAALLDLVVGDSGIRHNLIDWRMAQGLRERRRNNPGLFEQTTARIARANNLDDAILGFVSDTWDRAFADPTNNPYSNSRLIPTLIAALAHPEKAIALRTDRFNTLFETLTGERLFGQNALTKSELARALTISNAIFEVMQNDWGWEPRDLWDVQGFVWVTCATKLEDNTAMTNDELLRLFDSCDYFRTRRQKWSDEQTGAFCSMARMVHDLNLDWYRTDIPQVRFGRKEKDAARASATLASFDAAPARIRFSHSAAELGLEGAFDCDHEGEVAFADYLNEQREAILNWLPPHPSRLGHWPGYDDTALLSNEIEMFVEDEPMRTEPTNLILYGPPGTGKTYRTATEAVRLCDGSAPADRTAVMARYGELRRKGRIGFVTFHQNYSYEDFVEGLRPQQTSQEDSSAGTGTGFSLVARDGIFKDIARVAAENRGRALTHDLPPFDGSRKIFKMSLGRSWASEDDAIYQRALEGNYVVLGWGGDVDWSASEYDDWEAIKRRWRQDFPDAHGNDPNMSQTYTFRANMEVGSLIVISDGNMKFRAIAEVTGPYQFEPDGEYNHRRAVRWLWHSDDSLPRERIYRKQLSQVSAYQMQSRQVEWDALEQIVATGGDAGETSGEPEPHVLVIDEINRANVSKVFGELITLIEPDKRTGRENALTVTLPYSGDEFGVPANLHIIGTMNTADRSIAQLDTALRRRFRFKEIAPDPSLLEVVDGIDLRHVLAVMNERIEYLVDREHRIGHAFFMRCRSHAEIDAAMRDKVLPLLQEYFFDDWSRIAAIVGKGFVAGRTLRVPPGIDGGEDRISWSVRDPFAGNAYAILLGDETAPQTPEEGGPDHDPDTEA
ncbi:MAG: hypothetical protein CMN74_03670 [Sphingorhabdus sp.]|nr:hypothetical protein [Sphingorhabdus sp.]